MSTSNDSSLDVLVTTAQLIPLAIYSTLATVIGLVGNIVVLYSSIRYDAIQIDKVSLLLVQNLAVADLLYIFTNMLPATISFTVKKYVLGKAWCYWSAQFPFLPGGVNTLTVFTITAYRLRLLISPMNQLTIGKTKICILVIWIVASIPSIMILSYGADAVFSQKSAKCFSTIYLNKAAAIPFRLVWGSIVIIPVITITIINIILFVISARFRGEQDASSKRALITVCTLSGAFVISWIPLMIWTVWKGINSKTPKGLEQVVMSTVMVNAYCNPILYTLTNKRFGRFVWRLLSCTGNYMNISSSGPTNSKVDSTSKKTETSI